MKTKRNEELQSRREFFKKAAKGALPILAITTFGPLVFSSCDKDDDVKERRSKCEDCTFTCASTCTISCHDGCEGTCKWGNS